MRPTTVPDNVFQPCSSQSNKDDRECKANSLKGLLRDLLTKKASPPLAPLAAASAAIAIATDIMGNGELEYEEEDCIENDLVLESLHGQTSHAAIDAATASSDSSWHDSVIFTDDVSLVSGSNVSLNQLTLGSTKSHGQGSALNEVNRRDDEENHHRKSFRMDLSNKNIAEETVGSEYTIHQHGYESPAITNHQSHQMNSSSNYKSRFTPPSDASNVPPSVPRRSVSDHDKKNDEGVDVSATSPSERVQRLLDVSERKYRCSSLGNGPDHSSRFMRRSSLGKPSDHSSLFMRRASLDLSTGSNGSSAPMAPRRHSGSGRRNPRSRRRASLDTCPSVPSRPNPYDPYISPESRNQRLLSLKQSFLTPTMSKTSRTSPSISACRKRIGKTRRKCSIGAPPLSDSPCLEEEGSFN